MSLIRFATRIHFATNALDDALPEEIVARQILAPLVITDQDTGSALARLMDCLPPTCRPIVLDPSACDETFPAEAVDAVIAVGGQRALDRARRATERPDRVLNRLRFHIAVPTLPGPMGLGALMPTGVAAGGKAGRLPDLLICDPDLIVNGDAPRLATAGMVALVHCLEALLSPAWNPQADGIAYDGLRRAGAWLEPLVRDPQNADARREMFAAALNASLAAQKGFGAAHALARAIDRVTNCDGQGDRFLAALAGPVLDFNAPAVPDRMSLAAEALRLGAGATIGPRLLTMAARLDLPLSIMPLGLTGAGLDRVADAAAEDPANQTNPRHTTGADYRRILGVALSGAAA